MRRAAYSHCLRRWTVSNYVSSPCRAARQRTPLRIVNHLSPDETAPLRQKDERLDNAARDLAHLLASPTFAILATALEKGRHIGREDAHLYTFLHRNLPSISEFYRTWRSEVREGEGYYYLHGDPEHFGRARLSVEDMFIGLALAASYIDANRVARGGAIPLDDFLAYLERSAGSKERYLEQLTKRRTGSEIERYEAARASATKSLRRLDTLGFVDLEQGLEGSVAIRPRCACLRFAEPSRRAAGREAELSGAIE